MIDDHDVREMLRRRADAVPATPVDAPKTVRRARRRLALNGAVATVAAAAIVVAALAGVDAIRTARLPADGGVVLPTSSPSAPPDSSEPVVLEAGTYRIASLSSSAADFTVTFPQGWMAQHGEIFTKDGADAGVGFYSTFVDDIYADPCTGSDDGRGEVVPVGPGVDDLVSALRRQPGPIASAPVQTALGGYGGTRIDLTLPAGFDFTGCDLPDGLQLWLTPPEDFTVLGADAVTSVYVLDVDDLRQVFVIVRGSAASDEDLRELEAVLASIRIEP